MSVARQILEQRAASSKEEAQRLRELRDFLSIGNNPVNRKRVQEIDEQLKRIDKQLLALAAQLEELT